jgi:hypothetical protein
MGELYRPSGRRLLAKLVPTFADSGCHVVSVTDPYGRILGFLDRSGCYFFQVAPQLYSRGWVDHVPDPLLLRKFGKSSGSTMCSPACAWHFSGVTLSFLYGGHSFTRKIDKWVLVFYEYGKIRYYEPCSPASSSFYECSYVLLATRSIWTQKH